METSVSTVDLGAYDALSSETPQENLDLTTSYEDSVGDTDTETAVVVFEGERPRRAPATSHETHDTEQRTQVCKYIIDSNGRMFPADEIDNTDLMDEEKHELIIKDGNQEQAIAEMKATLKPQEAKVLFKTEVNDKGQIEKHYSVQVFTPGDIDSNGRLPFDLSSELLIEIEEPESRETGIAGGHPIEASNDSRIPTTDKETDDKTASAESTENSVASGDEKQSNPRLIETRIAEALQTESETAPVEPASVDEVNEITLTDTTPPPEDGDDPRGPSLVDELFLPISGSSATSPTIIKQSEIDSDQQTKEVARQLVVNRERVVADKLSDVVRSKTAATNVIGVIGKLSTNNKISETTNKFTQAETETAGQVDEKIVVQEVQSVANDSVQPAEIAITSTEYNDGATEQVVAQPHVEPSPTEKQAEQIVYDQTTVGQHPETRVTAPKVANAKLGLDRLNARRSEVRRQPVQQEITADHDYGDLIVSTFQTTPNQQTIANWEQGSKPLSQQFPHEYGDISAIFSHDRRKKKNNRRANKPLTTRAAA